MDWQEPAALGVVAFTVGLMIWSRWRRRRLRLLGKATGGCGSGCPAASVSRPAERIIYRARKGERAAWVVRSGAVDGVGSNEGKMS